MLTFLYLTIAIFFIVLTMTILASFYWASEIWESWTEPKSVENPSSQELFNAWKESLDPDQLDDFERTLQLYNDPF